MTSHARMTIQWLVPVGKVRCMTEALHRVILAARAASDFIGGTIAADVAHHGVIRYREEWRSVEALRRQFGTARFNDLLTMMEDVSEAPLVDFELPDGHRSREYLDECLREARWQQPTIFAAGRRRPLT